MCWYSEVNRAFLHPISNTFKSPLYSCLQPLILYRTVPTSYALSIMREIIYFIQIAFAKVLKPFPTITHPSIPEIFSKTPTIFFFLVYTLVFLVTPLHHTFISCHPSQLVKNGLRFEVGRDNIEIEIFGTEME